jgi:hypothetical protein
MSYHLVPLGSVIGRIPPGEPVEKEVFKSDTKLS